MREKQTESFVFIYPSAKFTEGQTQLTRSLQGCSTVPAFRELTF